MSVLKAHVHGGRVILDEPMNLPDGTPLTVVVGQSEAPMDAQERAELEQAIGEGHEDFENGEYEDARLFSKRLLAKT